MKGSVVNHHPGEVIRCISRQDYISGQLPVRPSTSNHPRYHFQCPPPLRSGPSAHQLRNRTLIVAASLEPVPWTCSGAESRRNGWSVLAHRDHYRLTCLTQL